MPDLLALALLTFLAANTWMFLDWSERRDHARTEAAYRATRMASARGALVRLPEQIRLIALQRDDCAARGLSVSAAWHADRIVTLERRLAVAVASLEA